MDKVKSQIAILLLDSEDEPIFWIQEEDKPEAIVKEIDLMTGNINANICGLTAECYCWNL